MSLKWCNEADGAIDQLMSDTSRGVDFVIFELENKADMKIHASGKGGRAKVEEILSSGCENKVLTGAFLALAVDKRGAVVSTRRKYIHFLWVGPSVGVMMKGRVNSMSGGFRDKFPASVIYLQLMGDLDELEEKVLEKNLLACGGAHKPSAYDFTNAALAETPIRQAPAPAAAPAPVKKPAVTKSEPVKEEKEAPVPAAAPAPVKEPEASKPEPVKEEKEAPVPVAAPAPVTEPEASKPESVFKEETEAPVPAATPAPVKETEAEPVKEETEASPVLTKTEEQAPEVTKAEEQAPEVAAATDSEGEEPEETEAAAQEEQATGEAITATA